MGQRVVRQLAWAALLTALFLTGLTGLTGCSSTPQPSTQAFHGAPQMPADDSLVGTPAASLLAHADAAIADGRTQAAGRYLERAIALAPDSSWLYRQMALVRLQDNDAHAAEGFIHHALRNAPKDAAYRAGLYRTLATCLVRQGDAAKADAALAKARQLAP